MGRHFDEVLRAVDPQLLRLNELETLQVNLGNVCNQSCTHCHVRAGPDGKNIMAKPVMRKIIGFLGAHPGLCLDITGGSPELNPSFRYLIESVGGLVSRLMVRTNLTVLVEPGFDWVPPFYREHRVVLIASLPCYTEANVDSQRGRDVFKRSIAAIKVLNDLGYGDDGDLDLNLVYNPGGDFLPGPQEELQADYRRELRDGFGVRFNSLFTMTNAPIGRFMEYLGANGKLEQYMTLLRESFNPEAAKNIMCRGIVNVDYEGILYNCDFNRALGLPIVYAGAGVAGIEQLNRILVGQLQIVTGDHCFCCTAGAGSSCTGSLVK